jgi:DNA-binding transcriptional LysR family regulator
METYHLLIFCHVCREKSISVAAEKLFLSQPTITNHLKSLEQSVQTKLINIERKKLTLTKVGEGLYNYASVILQQAMAADRFIEITRESSLMIGTCSLFARVMGKAINDMSKKVNPATKIDVKFGEPFKIIKELADTEIDIALVPDLDYGFPNLTHIRIKNNLKLEFFTSPAHPILKKDKIAWSDLGDYPLLIGSDHSYIRKMVTRQLGSKGLKTPLRFDSTGFHSEFFKTITRDAYHISLAVKDEIEEELLRGEFKTLALPEDICLDLDVVGFASHLSTSLAKQLITSLTASF